MRVIRENWLDPVSHLASLFLHEHGLFFFVVPLFSPTYFFCAQRVYVCASWKYGECIFLRRSNWRFFFTESGVSVVVSVNDPFNSTPWASPVRILFILFCFDLLSNIDALVSFYYIVSSRLLYSTSVWSSLNSFPDRARCFLLHGFQVEFAAGLKRILWRRAKQKNGKKKKIQTRILSFPEILFFYAKIVSIKWLGSLKKARAGPSRAADKRGEKPWRCTSIGHTLERCVECRLLKCVGTKGTHTFLSSLQVVFSQVGPKRKRNTRRTTSEVYNKWMRFVHWLFFSSLWFVVLSVCACWRR